MRKDTRFYWQDRIAQEQNRLYTSTTEEMEQRLRELYATQSRKIEDELFATLFKMDTDKYLRGEPYLNDLYRTKEYNELLQRLNELTRELGGEEVRITEEGLIHAYEEAQRILERWVPKGSRKVDFNLPTAIDPQTAVHEIWCLDGREFSDRIWHNKQKLLRELRSGIEDFAARGETPYKISRKLFERMGVQEYCSYRIARTETAHVQVMSQVDKYKTMGFATGTFYANDPCDECQEHDGRSYPLDTIKSLIPKHPNCTCSFLIDV